MTIDTIKNVLMRILSINKNLSEVSLENLFVASGWDNSDIKEGINIFRAYKLSGGNSDAVSDYNSNKIAQTNSIENTIQKEGEIKSKIVDFKIVDNKSGQDLMENTSKDMPNIVSLLDTHVPEQKVEIVNTESAHTESHALEVHAVENRDIHSNIPSVPLVTTPLNYISHQSHLDDGELLAYNKREGKPIFLVILDVVLFLITLGLLIYILLS